MGIGEVGWGDTNIDEDNQTYTNQICDYVALNKNISQTRVSRWHDVYNGSALPHSLFGNKFVAELICFDPPLCVL